MNSESEGILARAGGKHVGYKVSPHTPALQPTGVLAPATGVFHTKEETNVFLIFPTELNFVVANLHIWSCQPK